MPEREKPIVLSTRVTAAERASVRALAELYQTTVSDTIHRLLMPRVREVLREKVGVES